MSIKTNLQLMHYQISGLWLMDFANGTMFNSFNFKLQLTNL